MSIPCGVDESSIKFMENAGVISTNDTFIALIIELALFATFANWRWGVSVSSTITPKSRWWLTVQLMLNITVLCLPKMRPKNDTCICSERHGSPLGPGWQTIDVILQTLDIRWTLNWPPIFYVDRKHNRITRKAGHSRETCGAPLVTSINLTYPLERPSGKEALYPAVKSTWDSQLV